jgi:hypothetical protein
MAFSTAEKRARWLERHLDSSDGTKTRLQLIFDVSTTKKELKRIARHRGRSVTSLIREWAVSAQRIVGQLSARQEKPTTTANDA